MHIIGGAFKKHKIVAPKGQQTRPTKNQLRESFFNICAAYIEGTIFVDLFAGSGAMGLEALSRGAQQAYFIESHKNAIAAIEKNILSLNVSKSCTLIKGDVFHHLQHIPHLCDIIFADPPYAKKGKFSYAKLILDYLDQHHLIKEEGRLFLEVGPMDEIDYTNYKTLVLIREKKFGDSTLLEFQQSIASL